MKIDGFFSSPLNNISAFADVQSFLYREDVGLQDYFLALQFAMSGVEGGSRAQDISSRFMNWAIQNADRVSQFQSRRKFKCDVLYCPHPYFERNTENKLLVRTVLGLAETGANIVCLMSNSAPFRDELQNKLAAMGRREQVTFLDPFGCMNPTASRLFAMVARKRGRTALEKTTQILEPHGLAPGPEFKDGFEKTALFVEAWNRLADHVEFDAVVARCHWNLLCAPVCRTALQRGKRVVTFQQGVIGHTLDVPVTASKYVAFGQQSASFLDRMNREFLKANEKPGPAVDYVPGGCLFDTVTPLLDQFDHQTLLVFDVPAGQTDFYGIQTQCSELLKLADRLLTSDCALRRLIIRPHPFWNNLDFESCQSLVKRHLSRCEISHPSWSLDDDLRRSSIAIGIFSGALTVASACGLPTYFLKTADGYKTGDFACFSSHQILDSYDAFQEIGRLLNDRKAYAEASALALRGASEYYANGANLNLNGRFFGQLLNGN
jgi:hypothetical protein